MFPHMGRKVDIDLLIDKLQEELDVYTDTLENPDNFLSSDEVNTIIHIAVTFFERENVRGMIFPCATSEGLIFRVVCHISRTSLATEKRPRMRGNFVDLTS